VEASHALTAQQPTALSRVADASLSADLPQHSGFRLLPTADYAFAARLDLARQAEQTLDVQYYHIHSDVIGLTFLRALRDAAQRGVRVRLLVDDYYAGEIEELLLGLASYPHAQVRLFNPLTARLGSPLLRMLQSWNEFDRVNHRMHNKLMVADNALAIYGGRNIADEYFRRNRDANFIDIDVLSAGPVVRDLSTVFDMYWNSEQAYPVYQVVPVTPDPVVLQARFDSRVAAAAAEFTLDLLVTDPLGVPPVGVQLLQGRLALTPGTAKVFADPPNKVTEPVRFTQASVALRGQLDMIALALEEVVMVSPYLIPNKNALDLMHGLGQRGVKMRLLTNSLGSTDEPLAYYYYSRTRPAMLRTGAEVFELSARLPQSTQSFGAFGKSIARLHVKAGVIDRRWMMVGSVNLDARSSLHNTEMTVAMDCPALAQSALALIGGSNARNFYRVSLAQDGTTEQWSYVDDAGQPQVSNTEPDFEWLQWIGILLQSTFISEALL
jgi:putative cardiolipin synthase